MRNFVKCYFEIFIVFFLILMVVSCQKNKVSPVSPGQTNFIVGVQSFTKTYQEYNLVMDIGHDGRNCRGCVLRNGQLIHVDCQGRGNACRVSSNVSLYSSGNSAYIVTTDTFGLTSEDFFNMPSRSLFVGYDDKNNEVWLNIPAQLVYRDSSTLQFTFNGLYYSNSAAYSND